MERPSSRGLARRLGRVRFSLAHLTMTSMDRAFVVAGVLLLGASRVLALAVPQNPLADRCDLFKQKGLEEPTSASCMRCHDGQFAASGTNHPVDMDYGQAQTRSRGGMMQLRQADEVVKQGVFLPHGKITCMTCHDGRSPYKYALAIPPGAKLQAAVNPRDRATYADPGARARGEAQLRVAVQSGTYGVRVSPTPLCKVCHPMD